VLTDNGVQSVQHDGKAEGGFVPHVFGALCAEKGIEHRSTKPYHPWTTGQAERMRRDGPRAASPRRAISISPPSARRRQPSPCR
jgi:hypothetical protein